MAAIDSLRDFLAVLERNGQMLRIPDEVALEPDLGAAGRAISELGETSPALMFEKLAGYEQATVVLNVHGSWPNHALMLGMDKVTSVRSQFDEFVKRYANFPVKAEFRDGPPWRECVIEDPAEINLFELLPLFRLNRSDGGCYLDKAVTISREPEKPDDFNRQNCGIYRLEVKGPNRLGIQPVPEHDIAVHLRQAEERGEDLKVAIALGNDPLMAIVAGMPILYDQSEYEMCGALRGESYPIVHSDFSGVDIPWGAEIVIEGVIKSRVREPEGPFGEFTGSYSGGRSMPVIEVQRLSHRKNPILEHLYLGRPWTEIDYMLSINTCAPLYSQLKNDFPEVVAVNAFYTHGLVVIVSTHSKIGGFGKSVALRVLTTPHGQGYAKVVIVVDHDVDPFDLKQVMWAISTKFHPGHDLLVLPDMSVLALDPGSMPPGITHKMIIDATTPTYPDVRGHYSQPLERPEKTDDWVKRLKEMTP